MLGWIFCIIAHINLKIMLFSPDLLAWTFFGRTFVLYVPLNAESYDKAHYISGFDISHLTSLKVKVALVIATRNESH